MVDRLRGIQATDELPLLESAAERTRATPRAEIQRLEQELDDLVFEAYGLAGFERQLVNDMCQVGLDLFYRHARSDAVKPLRLPSDPMRGRASDLAGLGGDNELATYLRVFVGLWNQQLTPHGEFIWQIIRPGIAAPMVAVVLETAETGDARVLTECDANTSGRP